ncbi:MAG: flagellar biosynthesis anti-sigma factor FlgM [Thiomonas sp.]
MVPIHNPIASSSSTASSGVAGTARRNPAAGLGNTASSAAQTPQPAVAEQVSISSVGQMLQLASAQGTTAPASDARIAQLQAAIQSGKYQVDAQRIASGLLQDTKALLGTVKP